MTSLPDPSNDYQAPISMQLSRAVWDAVMASIGGRLRTLEGRNADYETVVGELQTQALAVISATITDEINARRDDLDALATDAASLADEIAAIRAGGIDAVSVSVSPIVGLAAAHAQAAIAELLGKINDANTAIAAIQGLPAETLLVAANSNLVAGKAYRITASGITLTLPASPPDGAAIRIVDGGVLSSSATATVARNGQTIMGLAENLIINVAGIDFVIWFNGTTWKLQ